MNLNKMASNTLCSIWMPIEDIQTMDELVEQRVFRSRNEIARKGIKRILEEVKKERRLKDRSHRN